MPFDRASVLERGARDLREELGGTYARVRVGQLRQIPEGGLLLAIDFGSNPDRTEELIKRVFTEIDAFLKSGDRQAIGGHEGSVHPRSRKQHDQQRLPAVANLDDEQGEVDIAGVFDLATWYRKLTNASVQAAARQYLNTKRYVLVSLYPEKR